MSRDRTLEPGLYEIPAVLAPGRRPVYVVNDPREIVAVYLQPADESDAVCKQKLAAIVRGEPDAKPTRDLELVEN